MRVRANVAAVEFAGDEVRLAVVKTGGRVPRVLELDACRAEYADAEQRREAMIEAVKTLVQRMKHRPVTYVLCVSSSHSVVRTLTIPFRGARKVAAAVPFELEPYLAFPIEELAVDYCTVLDADGQTDVLAVGLRRSVIEEQLAILESAGIDPEGVDLDAPGLTGFWRRVSPNAKGLHAALHVRDDGSTLAVVYNKTLAYFRYLHVSAEEVAAHPGVTVREVQNSIRAFQAGWRGPGEIASLTVTGCEPTDAVRASFEAQFDVPVSFENLLSKAKGEIRMSRRPSTSYEETAAEPAAFETVGDSAEPVGESSEFSLDDTAGWEAEDAAAPLDQLAVEQEVRAVPEAAVEEFSPAHNRWEAAIGVAMGAADGRFSLNFRKGDLAPKTAMSGLIPQIMVSSCLALVLLAGVAWFYHDARNRNLQRSQDLNAQIETLKGELAKLQTQGINVSVETFKDATLLDILSEIGSKMPDEKVTITELKVERPDTQEASSSHGRSGAAQPWITIRGEVKDDGMFSQVLSDLQGSALFQIDEPERKLDGAKSTFRIVARRRAS